MQVMVGNACANPSSPSEVASTTHACDFIKSSKLLVALLWFVPGWRRGGMHLAELVITYQLFRASKLDAVPIHSRYGYS